MLVARTKLGSPGLEATGSGQPQGAYRAAATREVRMEVPGALGGVPALRVVVLAELTVPVEREPLAAKMRRNPRCTELWPFVERPQFVHSARRQEQVAKAAAPLVSPRGPGALRNRLV
jgi:hypothetical protein